MELLQKQVESMGERSDKRLDRLEELIMKLASTSSNAKESPSLDENGNPITPSKESDEHSSRNENPNQFGHIYNNALNVHRCFAGLEVRHIS